MLHNVDSVVNQSVHLRTDDKSQAVKTETIRKSVTQYKRLVIEWSNQCLVESEQ